MWSRCRRYGPRVLPSRGTSFYATDWLDDVQVITEPTISYQFNSVTGTVFEIVKNAEATINIIKFTDRFLAVKTYNDKDGEFEMAYHHHNVPDLHLVRNRIVYRSGKMYVLMESGIADMTTRPQGFRIEDFESFMISTLRWMHQNNLCMPDIKPANIITNGHSFRLIDLDAVVYVHSPVPCAATISIGVHQDLTGNERMVSTAYAAAITMLDLAGVITDLQPYFFSTYESDGVSNVCRERRVYARYYSLESKLRSAVSAIETKQFNLRLNWAQFALDLLSTYRPNGNLYKMKGYRAFEQVYAVQ